jgi:hypothetical protein
MNELPPADRFSEFRDDNPYWNESVWFSFAKPEQRMNGIIQYYFRPNMGMLNGGPILWDPSGTYQWNCLYYTWSHLQAIPPGAQKFNMKAANSLEVRVLEPLARYSIRYDQGGLHMDLQWEAIGPMHDFKSGDSTQEKTARFHIEQPGRMKGAVRLRGRDFLIDCFSMRDASAGPREYETVASGSYFWGIASHSSFHAITMGEGREHKLIGGFMWRDGKMSSLVSGSRKALEYGRFGPTRVAFEGTDSLGRTMQITGRIDEGLIHTGYTTHTVIWTQTEWVWDGITHWGEHQEFCSAEKFRMIARGERPPGV